MRRIFAVSQQFIIKFIFDYHLIIVILKKKEKKKLNKTLYLVEEDI